MKCLDKAPFLSSLLQSEMWLFRFFHCRKYRTRQYYVLAAKADAADMEHILKLGDLCPTHLSSCPYSPTSKNHEAHTKGENQVPGIKECHVLGNKFGFFRSTSTPQMFLLFCKCGGGEDTQRKPLYVQLGFLEFFGMFSPILLQIHFLFYYTSF